MARVGDLVVRLLGDTAQFQNAIKGSEKKLLDFDKTAKKISENLTRAGRKMTLFVTAPIVAAGVASLKFAADLEKQAIAFETLLGSADRATRLFDEIKEFSATTPFQLPDLVEGSKRLLAFGTEAEDVVETMTNLGNAAMGDTQKLGSLVDAFGKVQARGKASMRELNMFMYAGVPIIEELAQNLDVTKGEIFKMSEQGKISFTDVNRALETLTTGSGKMAGMIEKQSQSLSGLMSTLKDNISLLSAEVVQVIIPMIKEWTEKTIKLLQGWRGMDDRTKLLILKIAGLAAALGPAMIALAKMITVVRVLRSVIVSLNATMLATPWGLAAVAAAGLTVVIWKLTEASREEKKLDKEIIALKDELYKVRGEEQVRIQETIVAKLRNAFVTAEAHAREMQEIAERGRAMGRGNVQTSKWQQLSEKSREKSDQLREAFEKENKELVRLTEINREALQQRIIGLPVLEEEEEEIKKVTEETEQLNIELQEWISNQTQIVAGLPSLTRAQLGLNDAMSAFLDELYAREGVYEESKEAIADLINWELQAWKDMYAKQARAAEVIRQARLKKDKEALEETKKQLEELTEQYKKTALMIQGFVSPVFEAFGQAMIDQANATEILKEAFKAMIVGILKAIGQKLVIMAAEALIPIPGLFNPAGAIAAGAGAAAAFIAAGVVSALQEGGVTQGITPALLHPNEAVLPLDNSEAMGRIADAIANAPTPSVSVGGNLFHISVNLGNKVLYDDIQRATKDRRILIDAGAVV